MENNTKSLAEMSDEELAICYMRGKDKAFDLLLEHNKSKLFSYIYYVVHDEDLANDLFQDTFIKIITKLRNGMYTPTGKFHSWCLRIAHNVIMDSFRIGKNSNIVEPTEDNDLANIRNCNVEEMNIEQKFINNQILEDAKSIMNNLPASQREVVYMRFFQQMSFKEISETTNVSINTALGRMRYALLNMRKIAHDHNISLYLY
ncbi:MAG: sigma-70 family RNA polymerase sigma factor [Prevotella sp.]|nr:sigma-70 family RNA polymerase sigma factor [Prevotella sp.]